MVQSNAQTVEEYLASLPEERRQALTALRQVILEHLPDGYEEGMQYGMIGYYVPLERFPETYNGQPLAYVNLASQKNYMSLYLNCVYSSEDEKEWFTSEWAASGKKLNMGKSCVRFKKLEDLPVDLIGRAIARTDVDAYIASYERARAS